MRYPQELQDQAHRLYVPGFRGYTKVAKVIGVPRTTVIRWLNPRKAERDRQLSRDRKRARKGTCTECGGPTSYNGRNGQAISTICGSCSRSKKHEKRRWTREAVIAAIQLFHERNGRPPRVSDWVRADRGPDYPSLGAVSRSGGWQAAAFASWSEAIRAAGYEPGTGGRPRTRTAAGRFAKEAA